MAMDRRGIVCGLAVVGFVALGTSALGQADKKSAKDLIAGSWSVLTADDVTKDSTRVPAFGPLPGGSAKFGADGRYSVEVKRKSGGDQSLSFSGTYTLDDPGKTLTLRIEQSSVPAWRGTTQAATVLFVNGDTLGWSTTVPLVASANFTGAELMFSRDK
jgi:hypothetical protein